MTKRNNEQLDNQVVEQQEQVSKLAKLREISKQKYEELLVDLKNPVKKAVRRRKTGEKIMSIMRGFVFIGLCFVIIFPIFQEISLAFRHPVDLNNKLVNWIPENYSLVNFTIAIELMKYWKGLWCNLQVSTISTICQLISTSLAGYAFSRLKFKGSNVIFWLVMLTLIVPPQAVSLSRTFYLEKFDIFSFFGNPGLFESLFGAPLKLKGEGKAIVFYITSLTGQGIRSALFIFLFRQFFRGIPIELEESAQIDGAGVVRTFWSVMLPNARGVITTVALFAFVWQWNDVYYTGMYAISGDSFPMLTRKLITMSENVQGLILRPEYIDFVEQVGEGIVKNPLFIQVLLNTAALLMLTPLLIGYLFVQRLFIEGVERSGIVG